MFYLIVFSVYFLRTRMFSYKTTKELVNSGHLIVILYNELIYSLYCPMKFLLRILHMSPNGPATTSPSSKLSFIRVHLSLGKSSTNALVFFSFSLAACKALPNSLPPHLPKVSISILSKS